MAPGLLSNEPPLGDPSPPYRSSEVPYSKPQPSLDGIELVLEEQWQETQTATSVSGVDYSTMLKAAWAVTLRCFQLSDVTCFIYSVDSPESSCGQLLYSIRVDPEEKLLAFLERLERENPRLAEIAPESCENRGPKKATSQVDCNSSIHFVEQGIRDVGSQRPTARDTKVELELTVVKTINDQIQARLQSPQPNNTGDKLGSILRTFQHVLLQITKARRDLTILDLDLCSSWDRKFIQSLTHITFRPETRCLHELILERCRLHPGRKAVCSFDGDLTYGELEDLSLRLARHLVHLGVRPETFVLSAFEKSTWAIVARLAILQAGGAYISIHASNPPAYLDSVIERTNAKIMLSGAAFADVFHRHIESLIVITPEWLRGLPAKDQKAPCETVQPSNACTVLFTSGSTGKPKGIIQEHRAYAAAIRDYSRNLSLDADARFLHFDDYAFDISNLEFLVPLILGGCCCVPGPMRTIQDLSENIRILNVNIAFLTPTVAIKLDPVDVPDLKILCVGGEPLPKDLLRNWAGTSTKLINQFGMGEAAVCCAYNDQVHASGNVEGTIGRPSCGAIWVVDSSSPDKLIPIGAVGEIIIEGPHLSRGYLDQNHQAPDRRKPAGYLLETPPWMAELHPERRSTRLYRSGDLARWNHDGRIEYIGRKDTIIKLDGCRIDVTEVEHLARKCLSPKDSIVVDLLGEIDGKENPRLTAFLYLDEHPSSSASANPCLNDAMVDRIASKKAVQIKAFVAESLPSYMIPTVFLLATWMPRTASNKTDRRKIRLLGQVYLEDQGGRTKALSQSNDARLLP